MLHLRGFGSLGIAVFVLVAFVQSQPLSAADIYSVSNVRVDERATDEVSAKGVGIAKAQREALRTLLERLTLRTDHGKLPAVTDSIVRSSLRDFAVSEEKFGGGRYLATLNVRFKSEAVRTLIGGLGIPYAEVASRANLVLPVYENAGSRLLWDEPNPWFDAWLRREPPTGLLPLVLPLRDLSDISEISAEQAVAGEAARLDAVAKKYKAFGVYVALGQLSVDPVSNVPVLNVTMTQHQPGEPARDTTRSFQGREGSDIAGLFDWAVEEMIAGLEESWKSDNLQQSGSEQRIRVFVPIVRLGDWLAVKRKITGVPSVRQMDVARLSIREAQVDVTFLGEPEQLRRALALKDLDMSYELERGGWVVRPRSTE